ncbi:hypothetical protein [Tepidicella baoligensis]|uniref:hypothetical protein n=1 Tax=Tepidicella baoligensis TaxID=2707016 RepID=UPI0015DB2EFA|nr:hypothetical protein [Tepidicella baoligensis]
MHTARQSCKGWVAACGALWLASAAWAAKPEGGPPGLTQQPVKTPGTGVSGSVEIGGASANVHIRFGESQRRAVREYYGPLLRIGHCPPGLAKKNNGCQPPGLAKAWRIGQPLPSGVVVYPLPRDLEIRMGTPPAGYRYVRVAADILLIAIGTSMVVDAIEDLARL